VTWDKVHLPNHPHELPFVGGEELHAGQELLHIKKKNRLVNCVINRLVGIRSREPAEEYISAKLSCACPMDLNSCIFA